MNVPMLRRITACAAAGALALSLGGCGANSSDEAQGDASVWAGGERIVAIDTSDLSGGVAATVGDVEIGENAVTEYLNNFRYAQGLQDDEDWGQWVYDAGYSIDGLRADTVEYFVNQELIRQGAEQEGVAVSEAEIDEAIATARAGSSDDEYASALDQQGVDEATYRETVRIGLLQNKLKEKVAGSDEVDEAELLEYLKLYYPNEVDQDAKTLDGINEERVKTVRDMLSGFNANNGFTDWMSDFRNKVGVQTSMMPKGMPYVVDLAPYEMAAAAGTADEDGSDESAESENSASAASASEDEGE